MRRKTKTKHLYRGEAAKKNQDKELGKWTREFIERYRTDLEALAKK